MAAWADKHAERLVLVAGHTHHPVFPGTFPPDLKARAATAQEDYKSAVSSGQNVDRARAAWELARVRSARAERYEPPPIQRPCYFNTGCCSFGDGDITGLEFSGGKVRLVRWLEDGGRASSQQLEDPKELRGVLTSVTGDAPSLAAAS